MAIPQQSNDGLIAAIQLINSMAGTGTKTETTTPSGGAVNSSNALIGQVLGSTSQPQLDEITQHYINQAIQSLGPNIANSVASGNRAYSDTSLADLQARAQGYAAAESGAAQLEAINKNNAIAASLVNEQVRSSRTTTTQTSASPLGKALGAAGIALGGYGLYNKIMNKDKKGDSTPNPEQLGGPGSAGYDQLVAEQPVQLGGPGTGGIPDTATTLDTNAVADVANPLAVASDVLSTDGTDAGLSALSDTSAGVAAVGGETASVAAESAPLVGDIAAGGGAAADLGTAAVIADTGFDWAGLAEGIGAIFGF